MKYTLLLVLGVLAVQHSVAPPVNQNEKDEEHSDEKLSEEDMAGIMEYRRYLSEVVSTLERDPEFREKLEKADKNDIHSGKIADELEFVNHKVRTRLDELKREELERLRHLATKENHLKSGLDFDHLKITEHLDSSNMHTFEIEDLKKLIAKTTKDLAEGDRRRREKFKEREMQRKLEEQEKLRQMDEQERKKYEAELEAMKEKHKNHESLHHPGSKQQLEEVWEMQDQMGNQDFNPKVFFYLHDVDGNGFWDQDEVKALFLKELEKLYAQGGPPEDLIRRTEEMERMREHVFNEADRNKDGLISYEEFFEQTKNPEFEKDEGWVGLDEQEIYTPEEFEAFKKHKQEEIHKTIVKGMPPPHPGNIPVQHEQFPPQYVNVPAGQGVVPPHQQQYQPQHHEQYQPQVVHQPQYQNQVPVQQMHGQIPQQEYRQQVPQHQMQGQVPVQQYHQDQVPQQHYQGQVPVQHQGQVPVQHQGQVPVQHQGQVPVQHQGQVPVQHQGQVPVPQAQVPVQRQNQVPVQQGQVPVQQGQVQEAQVPAQQAQVQHGQVLAQGQVPVQQQNFQQPPNPQYVANQAPQGHAGSQQANQNNSGKQAQQKQPPAHGVNRNDIHTAGKV